MPTRKDPSWPFPVEHSVVSDAETFVKIASDVLVDRAKRLEQVVLGKERRPFMQVPLDQEEKETKYKLRREVDDPAMWLEDLKSGKPITKVLKEWRILEAKYRGNKELVDASVEEEL